MNLSVFKTGLKEATMAYRETVEEGKQEFTDEAGRVSSTGEFLVWCSAISGWTADVAIAGVKAIIAKKTE